ncbi:MAG TPA: 50S ribosomal protein L11 methyltransferase [Nocardioides sp.]
MDAQSVVRIVAPAGDSELAADLLWQAGASAVGFDERDDGTVVLTADVAHPPAEVPSAWNVELLEVDPGEGLDAWREFAQPVRAGRRIVLHPAWLPREADDDDIVVLLDAGRSFGSGSHPTTRLVLASLEDQLVGGEHVLDVGCGSGVLSIGACLLGAASAVGIDIDPAAVDATAANAERNGVSARVRAGATPVHEIDGTFDVLLANIGGRVVRELHDDLVARARPGGLVVLAGFLDEQVEGVALAYASCNEVDRRSEDGWTVLTLQT